MKIVSGGQTGVDRGALDAAVALGLAHGGWCPRGRLAEDGPIPERYQLVQTESAEYSVRTEQNVLDSDATLILYRGRLSGGTKLTLRLARRHGRPCKAIDLDAPCPIEEVRQWLQSEQVEILNVAGPRESSAIGIAQQAQQFLERVLVDRGC